MRAVKKPKEQCGKSRIMAIVCSTIEKNDNTHNVQVESSKFALLSFDQGFQIVILQEYWQMYQNQSDCHLTVFCIDPNVVYFVNWHCVNVVYATYSISKWLIIIILVVCIAPLCSVHCAHAFKCPNVNFISTLHDFQGKARKKK